ncbi:MAG: SEC-C metal-binding domain-containing protein [Desulfuromonadaceae bacterium]|nr:SEC-C metal-binding domain-containing protein [Desulfuromonadaceae bacterium]MDD2847360.1 SEC-C metal-binding domain-containing protein [Desulfuromonadaceae bacterium]MDD4131527.1 SEC-C metal-binding domain-containing protein [Desulfuromonadaceae bacterium]
MKESVREENAVFDDLLKLCSSPGYPHVIAHFCYRDNIVLYAGDMKPDDYLHMFSMERLIRTEISTLIGLMCKQPIDFKLPDPDEMQKLIDETESLLKELHYSMSAPMITGLKVPEKATEESNPFTCGSVLREPIFYGGESAYSFQYRDLSLEKYYKDNDWLISNKGFSIKDAHKVVQSVGEVQNRKLFHCIRGLRTKSPEIWTLLPAFKFTGRDVAETAQMDHAKVNNILLAFTPPYGTSNECFNALNDFNIANAYPLIHFYNDEYILFQHYSIVEALYEAPFYWMGSDSSYVNTAMMHRGEFTEHFCSRRLEAVFGKRRVFSNINIVDSKGNRAGEIDALVVFADRAIVLQAKSKRLTLEARKGNDSCIKEDFKKSIQDSYDQGLMCGKLLEDEKYKLIDISGHEMQLPRRYKEIYILCVVSDHYPALSFQSHQFLKYEQTDNILPPLVMDIFLLDVMAEMLDSPLYFLSYLNRRSLYSDRVMSTHELTILSYHLQHNLWLEENTFYHLCDDISASLDLAMMVRRDGVSGKTTPDGILTRFKKKSLWKLIDGIEDKEDPATIELGFILLTLAEDTVDKISKGIDRMVAMFRSDSKHHDLTIGIREGNTGLTIHCNDDSPKIAMERLGDHCERRKYTQRADNWFGICITPSNGLSIRFGVRLDYKWKQSKNMDEIVRDLPEGQKRGNFDPRFTDKKIERNQLCPCGSGIKYKKCCIDR